jgi:hypothetical protein
MEQFATDHEYLKKLLDYAEQILPDAPSWPEYEYLKKAYDRAIKRDARKGFKRLLRSIG